MRTDPSLSIVAVLTLTLILAATPARAAGESARYVYDVSFDKRPIGTHSFEIDRSGASKRVRSKADFQVRIMFVSLYRYEHQADEHWQNGCLQRLDSETDDNGQRFAVRIDDQEASLQVRRIAPEADSEVLPVDCGATFAYWDLEQLERGALINSQTGKLTPVTLTLEGDERLGGEDARRYRLDPAGMDAITLWYRVSDQRWLQLETRRESGVLRYRLQAVEPLLPGSGLEQHAGLKNPVRI